MERVRTYLNPIRADQLKKIAEHHGFDSVAAYLDNHILQEWKKLHPENTSPLPGFEIYNWTEDKENVVCFAANGTVPITITTREAGLFGDGIKSVLNNEQLTFFIASTASTIDTQILFFGKKGKGYQFIIKWDGGEKKFGLSESIAKDLSEIFKHYSTIKDLVS